MSAAEFLVDEKDDDGIGLEWAEVGRAVRTWYECQNRSAASVSEAAVAFNLSPDDIRRCVAAYDNPFFWTNGDEFEMDGL